ncbi:hypothetical protein [Fodinicola acaciae]|uniref:hypothetical protein n=1 Tax=Fodinicola acaciae TaxID=2681555 RepID=UPI0013D0589C|nr:hypothetical protein [Fodinicola acaciae]
MAPWTVSAAVLPGGPSLPAGTYAFIRSPDNHIYMRNIAPGSQWIDTTAQAIAGSGPAVVVQPPIPTSGTAKQSTKKSPLIRQRTANKAALAAAPTKDVYLLSTNAARNAINTINDNDDLSAWEPWNVLGGVYTTSIGASYDKNYSTPDQPVNFFTGRGTDGILYLNGVNFGAQITAPPTLSYTTAYGRTALMYRGTDGSLYRMLNGYNNDPYYFTAPSKIASNVGSSASLAERSHRYYYRGNDNGLWYENGATWGAPIRIPTGAITGTPFALDEGIPDQPDRVNVFARGTDGHLYMWNTGTQTWTGLGGTVA